MKEGTFLHLEDLEDLETTPGSDEGGAFFSRDVLACWTASLTTSWLESKQKHFELTSLNVILQLFVVDVL